MKLDTGLYEPAGTSIKKSKRFWAGMISFFGLLGTALFAVHKGWDQPAKYAFEAIEVQVFVWMLSLGGTDAIVQAMQEWRYAKTGGK